MTGVYITTILVKNPLGFSSTSASKATTRWSAKRPRRRRHSAPRSRAPRYPSRPHGHARLRAPLGVRRALDRSRASLPLPAPASEPRAPRRRGARVLGGHESPRDLERGSTRRPRASVVHARVLRGRRRVLLPAGHHPGFRAPRYRHGRGLDVGRWRRRASSRRFVAFSFAGRLAGPAGRRDGHLDAHQAPARGFREAAEARRRPHQVPAENRASALQHLRGAQGACATFKVRRLCFLVPETKTNEAGENPL